MTIAPGQAHTVATLLAWCEDSSSHFQAPSCTAVARHQDVATDLALFLGSELGHSARQQHLHRSHSQPTPLGSARAAPKEALRGGGALAKRKTVALAGVALHPLHGLIQADTVPQGHPLYLERPVPGRRSTGL